tara:strand:- start:382 stop:591 length:210 start_codon:yes stop_codon:yes gene_type:complete
MIGAPKQTRLAKVIKWTNLKVITFKNFIWLKIANTYGRSLEKRIPVGSSVLPFRYDRCDGNGLNIPIDL